MSTKTNASRAVVIVAVLTTITISSLIVFVISVNYYSNNTSAVNSINNNSALPNSGADIICTSSSTRLWRTSTSRVYSKNDR